MALLLSPNQLRASVSNHKFVILHVQAAWNKHDDAMKQAIETLPSFYHQQILFVTLDFDEKEYWPFYEELGVRNVPFLAYFHNGTLSKGEIGACSTEVLQQKIQQIFGLHPPSDGRNTHDQRAENE